MERNGIRTANCIAIIFAAISLQLQDIVEYLENYLNANESAWTLPYDFFNVIRQRTLLKLKEKALQLACKYPETIFGFSAGFLKLEETILIQLLERNELGMDETRILNYLISWGIANTELPYKKSKSEHFPHKPGIFWKLNKSTRDVVEKKETMNLNLKNLKVTLRNCIPHIRFFQMTLCEYAEVRNKFKDILPNGLDDEIMQHFRDLNSGTLTNRNILPRRTTERYIYRHSGFPYILFNRFLINGVRSFSDILRP